MEQVQVHERQMARRTDPGSSLDAALDAKKRFNDKHKRVLVILAQLPEGATDFDLARITGLQQTSIGKRRGECRDQGWVEMAHEGGFTIRRASPSGSMAQVWRITEAGRKQLFPDAP